MNSPCSIAVCVAPTYIGITNSNYLERLVPTMVEESHNCWQNIYLSVWQGSPGQDVLSRFNIGLSDTIHITSVFFFIKRTDVWSTKTSTYFGWNNMDNSINSVHCTMHRC